MEKREERFLPNDYPQLRKQSFRLWWPNGYGTPYLYDAEFCAIDASTNILLSQVKYKAGIRELSYKDLDTQAKIYVNGKRLNPWVVTGDSLKPTSIIGGENMMLQFVTTRK